MHAKDLRKAVRHQPFEPFTLHLSDGKFYEITHAQLVMVSPRSVVVGQPPALDSARQVSDFDLVDLRHIVRLRPLAQPHG